MTRRPLPNQARFRKRVKIELLNRAMTVGELAQGIGRPRSTVSKAINRGLYPRVCAQIDNFLFA